MVGETLGERRGDAPGIGHQQDAPSFAELDAGRDAVLQRRTQDRDRDATREGLRVRGADRRSSWRGARRWLLVDRLRLSLSLWLRF